MTKILETSTLSHDVIDKEQAARTVQVRFVWEVVLSISAEHH